MKAIVEKVRYSGAWVRLEDHRRAWLPAFEMFCDHRPHHNFGQRATSLVGKEIDVCEIDDRNSHKSALVVSHVRVANDPWLELNKWAKGDVKVMEVTATTPKRALGIIKPGIRAEISLEGIAVTLPERWLSFGIPLSGDEVAGYFHPNKIDEKRHTVSLDYLSYINNPVHTSDTLIRSTPLTVVSDAELIHSYHHIEASFGALDLRYLGTILVVDNDPAILSLCDVLTTDFDVVTCSNRLNAEHEIKKPGRKIDLAVLDLHLEEDGHDFQGLALGNEIRNCHPDCAIVIITGAEIDLHHKKMLSETRFEIKDLIQKPFGFEELLRALNAGRVGRGWQSEIQPAERPATVDNGPYTIPHRSVEAALELIRQEVTAQAVVLFSVDPISYSVAIVAASGDKKYALLKGRLDLSPVRDVAMDDEVIFTSTASSPESFPKHRHLQKAYRYESCIGVPVHMGRAENLAYGLFAFHDEPRHFTQSYDLAALKFGGLMLRELMHSDSLASELRSMKPYELMGKLYGGMAHDLKAVMSDDGLFRRLENAMATGNTDQALVHLRSLRHRSSTVQDIVKSFRSMAFQQHEDVSEFKMYATLKSIVDNFKRVYKYKASVGLIEYSGRDAMLSMRRGGFEQLVSNILLNAAQQTELLEFRSDECVAEIIIEYETQVSDDILGVVRIYDNGPGIHRRDFSRIFDMHYTTKPNGCGMGLDICKQIASSAKVRDKTGRVSVKRSILLAGSVFEVSLPAIRLSTT